MKKKIFWLIQSNQITSTIVSFLQTLQTRVEKYIDLSFIVPESSSDILPLIASLNPETFKIRNRTASNSNSVYHAKYQALGNAQFTEGLSIADTLILDDLNAGNAQEVSIELPFQDKAGGIIAQIPSPLGSSDMEEKIFHAAIILARQKRIPIIGYELLPLDTRWTLAASLTDGVITRYDESFQHIQNSLSHKNIWLLPRYEASIFTSTSNTFHLNGVKASYHYRNKFAIPADRTVVYMPHNVAMTHEYKDLAGMLRPLGPSLHLMFGIGMDQVRGGYSHEESIKIIYKEYLKEFASYSFHSLSNPWEMMLADLVLSCSACFHTQIAGPELPCIIYDTCLPQFTEGNNFRTNDKARLLSAVKEQIHLQRRKTELSDILMLLSKTV